MSDKALLRAPLLRILIPYAPVVDLLAATVLFFTTTLFLKLRLPRVHALELREFLILSALYGGAWVLLAMNARFYRYRRTRDALDNASRVFRITLFAHLAVLALYILLVGLLFQHYIFFHRRFFFLSFALNFGLFAAFQAFVARLHRLLQALGHNVRKLAIAGATPVGARLLERIDENPMWGYHVVGFLDDRTDLPGGEFAGRPVLGPLSAMERLSREGAFDRMIICLPPGEEEKVHAAILVAEKHNIDLQIVPGLFHFATQRAEVTNLDGVPVLGLHEPPIQGFGGVLKRLLDLFGAAAGLLLLSPLFLAIAAAVKAGSRGPVFYGQERVGLDNRPFMMWKFRTMRVDAEAAAGPQWATRDDPRKTRIGAFLRKTSLDELPQLWNVLRGEMSLVGPRPERPRFVDEFRESVRGYMKRHRVKAGMTGWAQVNGLRGSETSLEKRIEHDLYYIENWSLLFDLEILFRTIFVVLHDDSAI